MQKTYLEELDYKLYYTKGARFEAHDRMKRTAKLSMIQLFGICNPISTSTRICNPDYFNQHEDVIGITSLIGFVRTRTKAYKEYPSIFQIPKQVRHDGKMRNDSRILHQTPNPSVIPNLVRDLCHCLYCSTGIVIP
ncbi:MAG: hypothetical protein RIC35_10300 [Marinoscillum sp.]